MGLAWLDIDDFKRVNDTFGHSAGDRVLRTVANRLQLACAPGDVIGRMGGDEFVVLRPDLGGSAERWGEHLAAVVSTPIDVLTDAKRMAGHVRTALNRRDVAVRYQPIVDLATGRIVSAEALVRMPGPHGVELAPHEFLQYVELQGLLPQLFVIVLERALADFSSTDCRVSVNVTTSDITSPGFVDLVAGALARSFGSRVVAEGIETEEQLTAARTAGADFGQGWYWAKDLTMREFRARLNGTPTPSA